MFESRALFDPTTVALVQQFFVPVITDPPWTPNGRERRNVALWDQSEAWKSAKRSAEIVLLAQGDRKAAAPLVYSKLKEPEALQAALVEVLLRDGVEVPEPLQAAVALRTRLRAAARALFAGPGGKAGASAVDGITALELWDGEDAKAALDQLDRDEATSRAEGKVLLHRLLVACEKLGASEGSPSAMLAKAAKAGAIASTEQLLAAHACLRASARELLGRATKAIKADAALRAELAELGVASAPR